MEQETEQIKVNKKFNKIFITWLMAEKQDYNPFLKYLNEEFENCLEIEMPISWDKLKYV